MALGKKTGGRTKGTPNKIKGKRRPAARPGGKGEQPLDYLLKIMRDDKQTPQDRLTAARSAAPYVHRQLKAVEHTGENGGPIETKVTISLE